MPIRKIGLALLKYIAESRQKEVAVSENNSFEPENKSFDSENNINSDGGKNSADDASTYAFNFKTENSSDSYEGESHEETQNEESKESVDSENQYSAEPEPINLFGTPDRPTVPKRHTGFKVTLIIMCCVLAIVLVLLVTVLALELFESAPSAFEDDVHREVNITVSDKGPTSLEDGVASPELLEQVNKSVVMITNISSMGSSVGTGFIITDDGYIVTNYHVVENHQTISVQLYEGNSYEATLVGYSERDDIAVIKINAQDLPAITLGKSSNCYVGEKVYAIGCPDGYELGWSITMGIISHTNRSIKIYDGNGNVEKTMHLIQTDAAVNHGNSGGPLINTRGEVVGIVTLKISNTTGLGFAIPIDSALEIIEAIIETGDASDVDSSVSSPRAMLGISCVGVAADSYYLKTETGIKTVTKEEAEANGDYIYTTVGGIYVFDTDPKYNAQGILQSGDIIVSIDNFAVYTNSQLSYYLDMCSPGDEVAVKIMRNGEFSTVKITLAKEIKS